jgi:hypothetical protein
MSCPPPTSWDVALHLARLVWSLSPASAFALLAVACVVVLDILYMWYRLCCLLRRALMWLLPAAAVLAIAVYLASAHEWILRFIE